ncbi:AglZ/HisF2 family acetamidino modification protein [bacterium SCSIO 12741]|nr:AglZ/HisF2 family acetamidino modification protein [bacterium SCSIO 12741]
MQRIRVIPVLSLKGSGLVKTRKFGKPQYIGDPINAVKIFNDKGVDELIFLDITATKEKKVPDMRRIMEFASECFMPVCYGGGISTLDQIKAIFKAGIEKVSLNTAAFENPGLITEAAAIYGNQSIVCSIDVKKNLFGKKSAYIRSGSKNTKLSPAEFAKRAEDAGAGEILVNSVDNDGLFTGYDLEVIKQVADAVEVPVVALGGAKDMSDFQAAIREGGASAVAAGSMFVYQNTNRSVLINYPKEEELKEKLYNLF